MGFVFGSFTNGVQSINNQVFLINCPLPLQNAIATLHSIVGTTLNYTVVQNGNVAYVNGGNATTLASSSGTYFDCFIQPNGLLGADTIIKPYGLTTFQIPTGWFAWLGDTISQILGKIPQSLTLMYQFFTTPADVSGIVWFNLVTVILLLMFTMGVIMIVRGGMG